MDEVALREFRMGEGPRNEFGGTPAFNGWVLKAKLCPPTFMFKP